ncbi:hypothetical protein NC653_015281 [Populus alba x Populus x berolinensis]|uniref:Uncharacterized protein n=1 Tax=Populus alba x Populus x berolinensis TaxID=444605 RepID=A0AAD6QK28_9ROSI|nr:hypothetical protein NC653_015281 [Populus alba x Populus x berolinensis]
MLQLLLHRLWEENATKTKGNTKNEGFLIILRTILLFTVKLACYKRIPDQSDSPGN